MSFEIDFKPLTYSMRSDYSVRSTNSGHNLTANFAKC